MTGDSMPTSAHTRHPRAAGSRLAPASSSTTSLLWQANPVFFFREFALEEGVG
jgi:hypothetical protein